MSDQLAAIRRKIAANKPKRKRRKLDQAQKKRAARLQELLERVKAGEHVQNKALAVSLSPEQYQSMLDAWQQQRDLREQFTEKPSEIIEYEERLRRAIFNHNRADALSRARKAGAKKLFVQAEKEFEDLLTYLQAIIHADPYLRSWFDRSTEWTVDGELGTDPQSVPRVVTSRSANNQGEMCMGEKLTKRAVKQQALEVALDDLMYEEVEVEEGMPVRSKKLAEILNRSDEDEF